MNAASQITQITLAFPNWAYVLFGIGFIGFVFQLGELNRELKEIRKCFPKMHEALIRISENLFQKGITKDVVYSRSPMQLTAEGEKIVQESGFYEFYETNKKLILARIGRSHPKSMAELDQACKELMIMVERSLPKFDLLEKYAYEKGIPILNVLFASAIALRNTLGKELQMAA